jgi:hypothetical protein
MAWLACVVIKTFVGFSMGGVYGHGQNVGFSLAVMIRGQKTLVSAWLSCVMGEIVGFSISTTDDSRTI